MAKDFNLKMKIDSETAKLIEQNCRYREINIEEFVEEAILEKLELEDIRSEFREENGVQKGEGREEILYLDDPEYDPKKKH